MRLEFKPEDFNLSVYPRWSAPLECSRLAAEQANSRLIEMLRQAPWIEIDRTENGYFGEQCFYDSELCKGCQGRKLRARLVNIEEFEK